MKPFASKNLNRNQIQLYCSRNACIFEYQIFVDTTNLPTASYIQLLVDHFKEKDIACLFEGTDTVYLKKKLADKVTKVQLTSLYSQNVEVTVKFRRHVKMKFCKKFFQALLFSKITDHLNDIGDPSEASDLNISRLYNVSLTQGFWQGSVKMMTDNSSGFVLTFDIEHQLTCQLSLYEFMRREVLKHQDRADCLKIVRDLFVGKKVMTRYNNKTYRIDDVDFATKANTTFLSDNGELISFAEYYQQKYGIQTRIFSQPMLINRVEASDPKNENEKAEFLHCLLPEFCYPVYNEWDPLGSDVYDEFMESLRSSPIVAEILSEWDLSLERKEKNVPPKIFLLDTLGTEIDKQGQKKRTVWSLLNIFSR